MTSCSHVGDVMASRYDLSKLCKSYKGSAAVVLLNCWTPINSFRRLNIIIEFKTNRRYRMKITTVHTEKAVSQCYAIKYCLQPIHAV